MESRARDLILIEGLEFYGYHGQPDAEQEVGHRYAVDVRLGVDLRGSGESDAISDTVNYASVTHLLLKIGTGEQYRLLERLATRMVESVFVEFPQVREVTIRVRKLYPPMNAILASVGVEITRMRDMC